MKTYPVSAKDLTSEYLTELIGELHPGVKVEAVDIIDAKSYGEEMVSTAARVLIAVRLSGKGSATLPTRFIVKLSRAVDIICAPFYQNEVGFYQRIQPELDIDIPRVYGAGYDAKTTHFVLLLEDLTLRNVLLPNVTHRITVENARAMLAVLAKLHGRYWESPRFSQDLSWVGTHVQGDIASLMNGPVPGVIQHEIDNENFKREMVQRLRTTGPELLACVQAVQRHQSSLPQTLLHGDTHLGNTYILPDGSMGLLDWQLMVRGYIMHDVNYFLTTALSIEDRRTHERDLLVYYLDRLGSAGVVSPPSFDDAWLEYRRALAWGVYIGWLTTPIVNYGWEINVLNHLRLTTAFEDHDTLRLVRELL